MVMIFGTCGDYWNSNRRTGWSILEEEGERVIRQGVEFEEGLNPSIEIIIYHQHLTTWNTRHDQTIWSLIVVPPFIAYNFSILPRNILINFAKILTFDCMNYDVYKKMMLIFLNSCEHSLLYKWWHFEMMSQ